MRRNIVYKVVVGDNGKYLSCNANRIGMADCFRLEYGVGKTTIPQAGKLFVFNTLDDALSYSASSSQFKIIKGFAKNPVKGKVRLHTLDSDLSNCVVLKQFWDNIDTKKGYEHGCAHVPSATYFVDSFTGLKVVK